MILLHSKAFEDFLIKYYNHNGLHKIEVYRDGILVNSEKIFFNDIYDLAQSTKNCVLCNSITNGYMCKKCVELHKDVSKFRKRLVSYLKIGYGNISEDPIMKNKKSEILIEKYGVDNVSKLPEVRLKISDKNSLPSVIEKRIKSTKKTIQDKYGVDHYSKTNEYKDKYKKTSMSKYGVEHVLKSEIVREKYENTSLEKYGVNHPMKNEEISKKQHKKSWETKHKKKYGDVLENFRDGWRTSFFEGGFKKAAMDFPFIKSQVGSRHFLVPEERRNFIGRSSDEVYVKQYMEDILGIEFDINKKSIIPENNKLEIDISNKQFKISIEYNGYYWHQIYKDKYEEDLYKCEKMREDGWQHLSINEVDIDRLDMLSNIINPFKDVIYARKCIIDVIENDVYKKFCEDHHLQGYGIAKHRLGLYHENELVQVMSFSKDRYGKCDYEMIRLVSKTGVKIVGGSQKLFKHFIKDKKTTIVSYSDNKYFSGEVYKKLGFDFIENTKPNYVWKKQDLIYKRYSTMKHKLKEIIPVFDPLKTENENMTINGFVKIKDLGNKKWIFDNGK